MNSKVAYYVQLRDNALAKGDIGIVRAVNADLVRWGESKQVRWSIEETAPKKRGRPPKPRCEHNKIPGRCLDCEEI